MVAIHLSSSSLLAQNPKMFIELLEDSIQLRGTTAESSGAVLKGHVKLSLPQPTKLRHLHLNFSGIAKTWFLTPPTGTTHETHTIMSHDWDLIAESHKGETLPAGDHLYPFEVVIPGDIPSSLTTDNLEVQYRFKASLHRPIWRSISVQKIVDISRMIEPDHPNLFYELSCSDTWNDQFHYDLSIPSRVACLGDTAQCTLALRWLNPAIKLKNVTGTIRQTVELKEPILPPSITQPLNLNLLLVRQQIKAPSEYEQNYNDQDTLTMRFDLPIPKNPYQHPSPHPTDDNDIYSVEHYLKLNVVYRDQLDTVKSFSIKVPITLMNMDWNEESCLPNYDQSKFTRVLQYSEVCTNPPPSYEVSSGTVTPTSGLLTPISGIQSPSMVPGYEFNPILNLPMSQGSSEPLSWNHWHHVPIALNNVTSQANRPEPSHPVPSNEKSYMRY
jgi:hypothetical protein